MVGVELHPHKIAPIFLKVSFCKLGVVKGIKPTPGDHESNVNKVGVICRGCITTGILRNG